MKWWEGFYRVHDPRLRQWTFSMGRLKASTYREALAEAREIAGEGATAWVDRMPELGYALPAWLEAEWVVPALAGWAVGLGVGIAIGVWI